MERFFKMVKKIIPSVFLVFLLMAPAILQAETQETPIRNETVALPEVQTYDELLTAIRGARAEARVRVEKAVEQERVCEAWEIGKLIDAHVLQHKERADYGKQVIVRLAKDLGMSDTELKYMLQFARTYPIRPAPDELSWAHYRELLSINDDKEREIVAKEAVKNKWSQKETREAVQKVKAKKGQVLETKADLPLSPFPLGKPGTYRYVKATVGPEAGRGVIDLGFSNWYRTSRDLGYEDGAIIETLQAFPEGSSPSDKVRLSRRTAEDLYTYRAWVVKVLDGDTVKVVVDLGFGVRSAQTLRLRGIDAPEIATADGVKAKEFLESVIASEVKQSQGGGITAPQKKGLAMTAKPSILIKTVKSDKYDRYLADIFIDHRLRTAGQRQKTDKKETATNDFLYVNQTLVDGGYAVKVAE